VQVQTPAPTTATVSRHPTHPYHERAAFKRRRWVVTVFDLTEREAQRLQLELLDRALDVHLGEVMIEGVNDSRIDATHLF